MIPGPRSSPRELLLVALLLGSVGGLLYGPNVADGGFILDDWSHAVEAAYSEHSFSNYWAGTANRPVLVLYLPLTHEVLGPYPWAHHLWSLVLAIVMSLALFALLRRLNTHTCHAAAIAVLVLLFPWSDATRFWPTAGHVTLAIVFALSGLLLTIRGFEHGPMPTRDARSRLYHAGGLALFALSVLTYEITGAALLVAGALYYRFAPHRQATLRWAADVAVIVPCLAWNGLRSSQEKSSLATALDHGREIVDGGLVVLADSAGPLGVPALPLLGVAALSVAIASLLLARGAPDRATGAELRRWRLLLCLGVTLAVAGWIPILPADAYYNPMTAGLGNRVNAAAAIGVVIFVYSAFAMSLTLIAGRLPPRRVQRSAIWTAILILVALPLAISYAADIRADQSAWRNAHIRSAAVLRSVKTGVPDPQPGDTIYTFNHPGNEKWGVPVFSYTWDLDNAVKLLFDNTAISAQPIVNGVNALACAPGSVRLTGSGWGDRPPSPYGRTVFVDARTGGSRRIRSRAECRTASAEFIPGPLLVDP